MKKIFTILTIIILFIQCEEQKKQENSSIEESDFKVVGYVRSMQDNWGPNMEKAKQLTHINFAFANINDGKVIEGHPSDTETLRQINALKKINPKLKVMISVGGWGWSDNFSDAVLTEQSRQVFANSAIDFMLRHEIDGVDLDWEYPGLPGDNNTFRPEDKENFTEILKLIRQKMDSVGGKDSHYLLTIATGASQRYLDHTDLRTAHSYLDFINIMTYDYRTGGSKITGHHSNFKVSSYDPENRERSTIVAIDQHLKTGIPMEKLVMGVPFYGRWWKGANPENNGLFQPAYGKTGSMGYKAIEDSLKLNSTFVRFWDETALAPYIYRNTDSLFMTYEDAESLKAKTKYVKDTKMGGIMFWEFNHDNGVLLNTIHKVLTTD